MESKYDLTLKGLTQEQAKAILDKATTVTELQFHLAAEGWVSPEVEALREQTRVLGLALEQAAKSLEVRANGVYTTAQIVYRLIGRLDEVPELAAHLRARAERGEGEKS